MADLATELERLRALQAKHAPHATVVNAETQTGYFVDVDDWMAFLEAREWRSRAEPLLREYLEMLEPCLKIYRHDAVSYAQVLGTMQSIRAVLADGAEEVG